MNFPPDLDAWPAPAKLNLMLRVLGQRDDGYHNLQTVFQFLDFGDRLTLDVCKGSDIRRVEGPPDVPVEQDLVVAAARLLQSHAGVRLGVDIVLQKSIPMGAGLGGGSSDAATVLIGLNQLWNLELDVEVLAGLGLQLGADVPVFVRGHAAFAEGVGEILSAIELDEPLYLVVVPPVHVSTGAVFSDSELTRNSAPITMSGFLAGDVQNDCAAVVFRRFPVVLDAIEWLGQRGYSGRLTGTGAAVFAQIDDEQSAGVRLRDLPAGWNGFIARGMNRSPLLVALNRQSG